MKKAAEWQSFEALRTKHAEHLKAIQPRTYAALKVKHQDLVLLNAPDFAALTKAADLRNLTQDVELLELAINTLPEGNEALLLRAALSRVKSTLGYMQFHAADAGITEDK
jgi:uncharacterized MnhB-related membrane protein